MKTSDLTYSKFWLGSHAETLLDSSSESEMDVFSLASYRRAISNFVFILTGRNIPVRFAEKQNSFTDQKAVYIGGELSRGEFDSTVGLSCHEAAHLLHPEYFDLAKRLWGTIPLSVYKLGKDKISKNLIATFAKEMFNWVEDRYIDDFIYQTAPGYRGYYIALYNRYFNLSRITKLLKSQAFRRADLFSYRFRIINLTNPESDLSALPKLKEIFQLVDLPSISRLSKPEDRLKLSLEIVRLVLTELLKEETEQPPTDSMVDKDGDPSDIPSPEEAQSKLDGSSIPENLNNLADVSEKVMEEGLKDFEKQRQFLDGVVKKTVLDEETLNRLNILEEAGMDIVEVGGTNGVPRVDCIVVRKMTLPLMSSPDFPYSQHFGSRFAAKRTVTATDLLPYPDSSEGVEDGIKLGTALGRKLQIRGESKTTITPRTKNGKLDRRLLFELAFDNDRIFLQSTVEQYKKAHLHLTVDASGSMSSKWKKTMTLVVALAKAVSLVNNLSIVISFRSGVPVNQNINKYRPYVVLAYDSRKDRFSKVIQLFPFLCPCGGTPEGLAFEAISNEMPRADDTLDSYFLNLSDGEPMFSVESATVDVEYRGEVAYNHTKRQVDRIRAANIEVLSYFVEESLFVDSRRVTANMAAFRRMYGKDAQLIDVSSVTEIAQTMNRKFLQKSSS